MLHNNIIFLQTLYLPMPKKKLTLSINKDILTQAKSQEINISSFLEMRLVDYMTRKVECSRQEYVLIQ